ncbi:MAG: sulfatase [Bacteroidota bacterium]
MKIYQGLYYLAFTILMLGCTATKQSTPKQKPNILFIVADDLGYTDLSCMGSTYYETPNIDQIAQKGMIFTNGYAACQVCSPSRASLMTGKSPLRHGITDYIGAPMGEDWRRWKRYTKTLPPKYKTNLPHEYTTLPEALKSAGYATFFAGKWHLGGEGSLPTDHGFDENQGGYHQGGPYSGGYFSPFNNPQMEDYPDEKGMSMSAKLAKETSQFIERKKDQPFLAYLSFYAVHAPIQTTQKKWDKYRQKAEAQGIAENGFRMERRLPIRKQQDNPVYAGLIEEMDDAVGQVLATLKRLNLADNTIVIFTSDNGGVASGDNYSTNLAPLRGGKGYQWEGGLRVPFLINVPWMQHNGKKDDTPVIGTDFFPTLLDLANVPLQPEAHQDGQTLMPVLQGEQLKNRTLFWHYPHYGNQGGDPSAVVRKGDFKFIRYYEDGSEELYNLENDLGEQQNVMDQYPELGNGLRKALMVELENRGVLYPEKDPLYDADSFQLKYEYFEQELMPRLEKQRKDFLRKDWQPNKDWWGSQVTID